MLACAHILYVSSVIFQIMDKDAELEYLTPAYLSVSAATTTTNMGQLILSSFALTQLVYPLVIATLFYLTAVYDIIKARETSLHLMKGDETFMIWMQKALLVTAPIMYEINALNTEDHVMVVNY